MSAVLLLTGCTQSTPPAAFTPEDVRLDAAPDEVWQALTMVYTDLNIPIENMDRSSWFMRSERCGSPARAMRSYSTVAESRSRSPAPSGETEDQLAMRASVTTLLAPGGDGTVIRNRVNVTGATGGTVYDCVSTGATERSIVAVLQARLR